MKIAIINGPNLNLLGIREPGIYGRQTFEDFLKDLKEKYPAIQIDYFQSNVEGELVTELQRVGFSYDGILLNAAAYTHTSVAIGDAVAAIKTPGDRNSYQQYRRPGRIPAPFNDRSQMRGCDNRPGPERL